ncbi:MAG: putative Se/S carrier-like protein [Clostridium sp.]|uniref:putative Se/S carrier-like protein n=1 Tax=Clostridium sp. TaxID=1506 RepID=UPI003D6C931C
MIVEENEYLVVYPGRNTATLLYNRLLKKSCYVELISTPTKIYYGCSLSIKFKQIDMDIVNDEILKISLKPKGVYKIIKKGKFDNYEKLKL